MIFFLSAGVFAIASVIFFTIFGVSLISYINHEFSVFEKTIVGTIVGFVFFTLFAYFFFIFNVPILAPVIAIATIIKARKGVVKYKNELFAIKIKKPSLSTLVVILIFVLGVIGQLAIIAPSGITVGGDILFWSAHGHDGMWHIALMEEIKKGGILQNPVFTGERLVNYHFFSDIAPAIFSKYLFINNLDLYFRFFPLLYSVLLGGSVYVLVKKLTGKISPTIWALFFTYFAGSFGYIVTYLRDGSIRGESIFWATQIQSASGNPPQIISDFLVITYLYFFYLLMKKLDWKLLAVAGFILASLSLFKVYAAIALIVPTLGIGLWQLLREKKFHFLILGLLGGVFGAVLYVPNVTLGTSFLIFEPWWYIRTMIVIPGRLDWLDHELRRQTYVYEHNWKRVIFLELQGFTIFIIGNLGMRIFGFWDFFKDIKSLLTNYFNALVVFIIIFSVAFPLIFLQRGVVSNTSQFLQYFILLFGILAGISTSSLIQRLKFRPVQILVALAIVALAIPTQAGLLQEFYSRPAFAKISKEEVEALAYLKEKVSPNAVILTPPYNPDLNLEATIPEIWDWFDTSYVSALSARHTYFDDYEQVDIMGYDYRTRLETKKAIFSSESESEFTNKIHLTGSDYIYFPKKVRPLSNLDGDRLIKIYENSEVEIWKVN